MKKKDDQPQAGYIPKTQLERRRVAQDLLLEKEKLRALTATLHSEKLRLEEQVQKAREDLDHHQQEHVRLQRQVAEIEEENRRFSRKYSEVERHDTDLANLYVAIHRLNETLDRQKILAIIQEILSNLIGVEELAVFEFDPKNARLSLLASAGIETACFQKIPLGAGLIGLVALTGETYFAGEHGSNDGTPYEANLTACIPLKVDDRVTGAIAVFRLVQQKDGLESLDHKLLDLLATHAAKALYLTRPHTRGGALLER